MFAVLYIDLNNFKAYNDKYGFEKGDKVLLMTAETLSRSLAREGQGEDFVGHIGGDDFIIIPAPERAERIAKAIIEIFDEEIRSVFSRRPGPRLYPSKESEREIGKLPHHIDRCCRGNQSIQEIQ